MRHQHRGHQNRIPRTSETPSLRSTQVHATALSSHDGGIAGSCARGGGRSVELRHGKSRSASYSAGSRFAPLKSPRSGVSVVDPGLIDEAGLGPSSLLCLQPNQNIAMRLHIIRRCTSFAFPIGAALLVTSSIATSQTQDQGETKAVEASTPSARAPLSIPLSGLTKDNASKVKAAIEKISHTSYKCSSCSTTKKEKGQCCNMEMKAEQHTVAANVVTKPDGETISLTINEGERLSLTEVERALSASGARVERNEIPIANFVQLTFKGPKNKEDAGHLEESLKEVDIFKTFDFEFDEGSKNVIVLSTMRAQ